MLVRGFEDTFSLNGEYSETLQKASMSTSIYTVTSSILLLSTTVFMLGLYNTIVIFSQEA